MKASVGPVFPDTAVKLLTAGAANIHEHLPGNGIGVSSNNATHHFRFGEATPVLRILDAATSQLTLGQHVRSLPSLFSDLSPGEINLVGGRI